MSRRAPAPRPPCPRRHAPHRHGLVVPGLLLGLACAGCGPWRAAQETAPPPATPALRAEAIAADVAWLADPAREGRGLGTPGLEAAAAHIARGFEAAGLEPGGTAGYLQPFEMPVAIEVAEARLAVEERALARGEDFRAPVSSASGSFQGPLVFAGYGISDARSGWDDYGGVDVEGRPVLVLEGRPRGEGSPLAHAGAAAYQRRAYKVLNARRHGASAVLLAPQSAAEALSATAGGGANPTTSDTDVVTLELTREAAERIVAAGGADLGALQETLERAQAIPAGTRVVGASRREPTPARASRTLSVRMWGEVRVERTFGRVANVVGIVPGADPALASQAVLVGAHYDGLGRGGFASLAPDRLGEIHPGADDNASGSAGLLALARAFGGAPPPRRTLVLAAFTAEEVGLAGSAHYAEHPAHPLEDTVAMLNLDMIGRLRDDELTVFGTDTAPPFEALVRRAAEAEGLALRLQEGGLAPSDQSSFVVHEIPVLFFFTGLHADYHTPEDVAARVDAEGEARVLSLAYRVARALLDVEEAPVFAVPAAGEDDGEGGAPRRREGYGPYLGTVPAFGGAPAAGVRLSGVRAGSPAERAGLRAGDVLVSFAGARVRNLEELAALLFAERPGHEVELVVRRDGEEIRTRAVLGRRR